MKERGEKVLDQMKSVVEEVLLAEIMRGNFESLSISNESFSIILNDRIQFSYGIDREFNLENDGMFVILKSGNVAVEDLDHFRNLVISIYREFNRCEAVVRDILQKGMR